MLIDKKSISFNYINIYDLSKEKIGFPIFQRFYNWKDKQLIELLNDIEDVINNPEKEIYLLDFIWYEEDGIKKIADGQQRIVTLNILIKAINDFIDKNNINIEKIKLFDLSYDNNTYNKKYDNSFSKYMQAPFKKIYLILYKFIEENKKNIGKIKEVIENKIWIYIKKTSSSDDAFSIFTQINTGGKPLSKDEVIKTAIDQYSKIYNIPVKYTMKDLRKTISGYYKYLHTSTSANFDTIAIMGFLKEDIVNTKENFQSFVNYINVVTNVSDYSISYIISYINRSQLFDIVNVMAIKGIDLRKRKEYLELVMFPLSLLSIVMTMKKSNPGGIIRSLYSKVIEMIKNENRPNEITEEIASFINENSEICKIPFDDFKKSLGKKDLSTRVKQAVLLMDVITRTTSSNLNIPSINLEHIYPQRPAPEWAMHNWPTDSESRSELVHNIGNYLLLNESVNKRIKNKYITQKIVEYDHIVPKDLALKTEMNTVDFVRFEQEREEYIYFRQGEIAKLVYENFPLAKVIITK
jgi:hypothetical protein